MPNKSGLLKMFYIPNLSRMLIFTLVSQMVFSDRSFPPKAKITLINLDTGEILRTITDKSNHEVILDTPLHSSKQAYLFQCNASVPVEWSYIGEGAPLISADVGRHFVDFYNVDTYTYQAILYFHQLNELQSGRFICKSSNTQNDKSQIHYDVFVPGNGSHVLVSNTEKKVFVSESKLLTSLPCEVTDPSVTLNLYKENGWGAVERVDMNDSVAFRPRKGFILKLHDLPNPFGTYLCITADNRKRRKIHLIPESLQGKYNEDNAMGSNVRITYDHEYNRMLCCGDETSLVPPKLQWASCGSVLDCKIKSVCFEDSQEDRCGRTEDEKWRYDHGPLPKACSGRKLNDAEDFGIFKCSSKYQLYLLNRGQIFLNFDNFAPPSESILTLTKTSTEPSIYLGSQVEYHCNSTRFYFAYGLKWAFKRGNDDIEFVEETSPHIVREQYPLTSHMRKTTFRILNPDIKAIICFVPIAASPTEWRTVSLPIFIRDSVEVHHLDYVSNRVPFSSPSHLQPVVEPYSTSRPKLFLSQHHPQQSIEVDPTPTVDIEEIFSYARKPQENNEHIHNRASFHSSENYRVSSQIKFPTTSYNNHEYKYSKTQPIIRQETDIITVDNFRQHHRQKLHNQHSDIQEANRRHREKLNKYPKSAASSSSQQVLTPVPTSQPESEYATTRRMYTKTPYYRDGYNFEERNREKEFPKFEGMEYKVSSKLNVGNHQHYKQGVVQDVESYQTTRLWSQPKSTTTIRPSTIFNDRRYINEGESSQEIFSAPTPSKLTLNHRQPIIHFDSTQNQYSLRDPMISSTNPSKKYSTSGNDEKYYNSNIKPLSQHSWNHGHNNYYNRPSINSRRDYFPALSAEIPMALEDVGDHPYAFDDFYISSLTKGKTLKKKTPFKNYYSHGSQESLGNSKTSESHYQSIPLTPDYDKEKEQYYFQRYAGESKENSWTGIIRDN